MATLPAAALLRKKYGVRSKDGTARALPVPPKGHALARKFAAAALVNAKKVLAGGQYDEADVIAQVRKANSVLYGKPAPTAAEKTTARQQRFARDVAYYTESDRTRAATEAYFPTAIADTWDAIRDKVLTAAQGSKDFGGPGVSYGEPGYASGQSVSSWDISLAAEYPQRSQVVVSNAKTGELWEATYALNGDSVTFSDVTPVELQIVKKNQEALREARDRGQQDARVYPVTMRGRLVEAKDVAGDGSIPLMVIRMGDGNPADKNYYDESFIDSIIPLLEGAESFYDHPSLSEEKDIPERRVRDKCGWLSDPWKGEFTDPGVDGAKPVPAAFAMFHPRADDPTIASLLRTSREKSAKYPEKEPFVASSINAYGVGAPGENPVTKQSRNIISKATTLNSVDMVTQAGAAGRPMLQEANPVKVAPEKTSKVALAERQIDPHLGVDIRTDAEKAADKDKAVTESVRLALKDLFTGPLGKSVREAAGVDEAADPTDGAKFSNDQVNSIADKVGLKRGGAFHTAMKQSVVDPEDQADGGKDDAIEGEEPEGEGESVDEALTTEEIKALTPEAMRTRLLKHAKDAPTTESGKKTPREIALETKLAETKRALDQRNFTEVVKEACDKLKFPEGRHRRIVERECSGATSNAEIAQRVRAYHDDYLLEIAPAGVAAGVRNRESGGAKPALVFLKPGS